jgi:ribokinase
VVGNAGIDTTWRMPRFPLVGETLVASGLHHDLGGKGLNQAVAAARAGADVRLWAALGKDDGARRIRELLAAEAITDATLTAMDLETDRSTIFVDAAGDNLIVSSIDCAAAYDPLSTPALDAALEEGDILVMQGNLSPDVTEACLALGHERGAVTIFNPSPIATVASMPWPLVTWIVANRGEAQMLTEHADPAGSARRLITMGAGGVVVTLGAGGAVLVDPGGIYRTASPGVRATDTAGAGDVVCGVFAGLLARGKEVRLALDVAIAAASLSVARPGTSGACPSRAEIDALLAGADPRRTTA